MNFHDVRFPTGQDYGSSGGPTFSTSVVRTESGVDHPVSRWNDPRHEFNAQEDVRSYEDLAAIRAFYIARKGPANGFRYKDWQDYHSHPTSPGHTGAPGMQDQLLGTGDGVDTTFQLIKTYASGPTTYTRAITKPVSGTVRAWVNGAPFVEGVDYTVSYSTGVITFATAPAAGHAVHASFEYDVPVRFVNDRQMFRMNSFGDGSAEPIELIEITDASSANVGDFPYGGASERAFGVSISISTSARLHVLSATTTGLSVALEDPATIPPGSPIVYVVNDGANAFTLRDHLGASLAVMAPGTGVEVSLSLTALGAKVWYAA